jgi:hypothetical protein
MSLDLRSVAHALGGEVYGSYVLAPGPGHSRLDRSLSLRLVPSAPDGFVVNSFAGDDWRACRDHVCAALGLGHAPMIPRRDGPATSRTSSSTSGDKGLDDSVRVAAALRIWNEAIDPRGTLVETYLVARGLTLPDECAGAAIRFHPSCPFRIEGCGIVRLPAMIALMRDAVSDEPRAVHRTALRADGTGKAEMPDGGPAKRIRGPSRGAVVKLSPDETVTYGLGLAEGVETALAVMNAGWRPIWAAGSAGAVERFPVLGGIEHLTLFADNDPRGLAAARACAHRWQADGCTAEILFHKAAGADWNDEVAA